MQIAIQWKNKEDEGSTPAFIRIIQTTKDNLDEKLIFGWPITSEVTRVPGAVQFSVRFYDRVVDSEEFNYSLVTLPTTLNIGASLSAVLDEDSMDDPRPTILSRLQNSRVLTGSEYAIAPVFVYPYRADVTDLSPVEVDFGTASSYLLQAMARKDGSKGSVTYKWYKAPLEGDDSSWVGLDTQNDANDLWKPGREEDNSYILVTEWHNDFNELSTFYYQKEENGEIVYKTCSPIASKESFAANLKNHNNKLYIKGTSLQLNISPNESVLGKYCVDARVGFIGTYAYASGANSLDDGSYLGGNYSDNVPMWIVRGPETVSLNPLNHHYDLREGSVVATLSGENLNNTTSYAWYYSPTKDKENAQLLEGKVSNELTITNEGYYYAVATNYKNGESNTSDTPIVAAYRGIEGYSKNSVQVEKVGQTNTFKITINNDKAGIEESFNCQWWAFGENATEGAIVGPITTDPNVNEYAFDEDLDIRYIQISITISKGTLEDGTTAFATQKITTDVLDVQEL